MRDKQKKDIEGLLQGRHPTRADEALDAEPPADDDPDVLRPHWPESGDRNSADSAENSPD